MVGMLQFTDPRLMAGRIKLCASPHGSRPSFGDGCRVTNRRMVWRQLNKRTTRRLRGSRYEQHQGRATDKGLGTWGNDPPSSLRTSPSPPAFSRIHDNEDVSAGTWGAGGGAHLGAGHELQRGRDGLKDVCEARFGVCIEYGLQKSWQRDRHATDHAADHARSRNGYLARLALPGANLEEQTAICSSTMVTPDLSWLSLCGHSCSHVERAA